MRRSSACTATRRAIAREPEPLRVAHLVGRIEAHGGVRSYLQVLLPALANSDVENVVLSGDSGQVGGVEARLVRGLDRDGPSLHASLDAALAELKPDICVTHLQTPGAVATAAAHSRVVAYVHDYAPACPGTARYLHRSAAFCVEGPGLRCFRRAYTERCTNRRPDRLLRAYRRAGAWQDAWAHLERVFVASPFVAGVLVDEGVDEARISVVGYPVEAPAAVAPEPVDVLYLGRLVESKGVHVLLRAACGLDRRVVVAGDGPARPALEAEAARLGVRADFCGWVDDPRRAALLRGAQVVVMPSLWQEPFGIVGVEALAAGTPVIGSDVGGIPSWLEHDRGGLLVPPGDVGALRAALALILHDPARREALATTATDAAQAFRTEPHVRRLLTELG